MPNAEHFASVHAQAKQRRAEQVIEAGAMTAFPDAIRLVVAGRALGWPVTAASSLKDANAMMRKIRRDVGLSLFDAFGAKVCCRDLPQGEPNPEILLLAAKELLETPRSCFVMEDAPTGIEAARAGGMAALVVARLADAGLLSAVGATLIVTTRDEVVIDQSSKGRLRRKAP
ncbi:HAD-IA family hydrolase [Paraburkholderia sp. BCC1876]|uniref:HAD-IA family hydrolase n=1 Tax=Paraburkholderia sp. BCC1876 TaxID=2676303 RepID=UPI001ABBD36F|nr:HAD-IA family hydrolase [Paraburkholderia sp. BCC1876]